MLRGMETNGYVIVSAGKASILSSEHQPVWRDRQPRSKTTWIGTLEFMQVGVVGRHSFGGERGGGFENLPKEIEH